MATRTSCTVKDIFEDFSNRRASLIRALTDESDKFHDCCDPEKENLCLYAYPDGTWEVRIPVENVPTEIPEPALGINFARDVLDRQDWIILVATHSDSWLLATAFFLGAELSQNERKELFTLINELPTILEVVMNNNLVKANVPNPIKEEEGDYDLSVCGVCDAYANADGFWIQCDSCKGWYHGQCVKINPTKAHKIKKYKCPSCRGRK